MTNYYQFVTRGTYYYQYVRRGKKDGLNIIRVFSSEQNTDEGYNTLGWICTFEKGDEYQMRELAENLVHQFVALLWNNKDPREYPLAGYGGSNPYYYGMRLYIHTVEMPEKLGNKRLLPRESDGTPLACYHRDFIKDGGFDLYPREYNPQDE